MKVFLRKCLCFSCILLSIFAGLLYNTKPSKAHIFHMINVKDSLMDHTPQPRIIFLGGSSVPYGINSPMIMDSLGVSVVNAGVSAGFGLKFILEEAIPHLKPGDTVVIVLEYAHLYTMMYGCAEGLGPAMLWTDFKYYHTLNKQQRWYALEGLPTALRMNLTTKRQTYCADAFNAYGDVVLRPDPCTVRANEQIFMPLNEEYGRCLLSCVEQMEAKGCRVLIAPQPICRQSFRRETADEVSLWLEAHGRHLLAPGQAHCFPDALGLDTDNHLTEEGARRFTGKIIQELKQELNN